ncbi:uncharacterized protein APUU_40177A [Aspergillus puulaauensis]|uniref:Uncharacterized protein n=1 Tax=Aspergillus puulaauensis TaxID=1220207 RepID=A0A7R7XMS3_9EURO|nr:uncharacterized protein APUU_40177A [Aspergillus puulaauensis]BCS23733.1 hypothetical protein APUU_40177A [Aspergillus puulaauensis]
MSEDNHTKRPSASANKIPTVERPRDTKRSISYNSPSDAPSISPSRQKSDQSGCGNMIKASLTGILNSGEVKTAAGSRKVQDMLMETERNLREQRRRSLHEASPGGGVRALLDPMESIRRSGENYNGMR